jgi:hypothetical protein
VYVGSGDNYLYAINSKGTLKWKFQTGGWINASPSIGSDGTVYVGSGDSYLYAVNSDGSLKWKYETGSGINSSPAIGSDGTLYVGSNDGCLYAFASEKTIVEISPPTNVQVSDVPNDNGHQLRITWNPSPSESDGNVSWYNIFRSRSNILTDPILLTRFSSLDSLIYYEQLYTVLIDSVAVGTTEYIDNFVPINKVPYYYWLQAVGVSGASQKVAANIITSVQEKPTVYRLGNAYPNPFNPSTTIKFSLVRESHVVLIVYNLAGQKVVTLKDNMMTPGLHSVVWNAKGMSTGLYYYSIKANGYSETKKMTLLK